MFFDGAAVDSDGAYVSRKWEAEVLRRLEGGEWMSVVGPTRVGKSSLLLRVRRAWKGKKRKTALGVIPILLKRPFGHRRLAGRCS